MQVPPADHPLWKLLRLAVVGAILLAFLAMNYNRLDERDATTILGVLLSLAGFDATKAQLTKSNREQDGESST